MMDFEFKFADYYNWNKGQHVLIQGSQVTDDFMGQFHLEGIAKEFPMDGSLKRRVRWSIGNPAVIEE